jgi:NADH-quinone oxidoreductase subunit C
LYQQLIDLSFVDYPERKLRFEIFYNLLSVRYNNRLTILSSLSEDTYMDSVTSIYPSAG